MRTDITNPMKTEKSLRLLIPAALMLALTACGGGGGGGGTAGNVPAISLAPTAATSVAAGGSIPLALTVSNLADISVSWSVQEAGGGTVSLTGVYTAPPTPGTYHVQATSHANGSLSATQAITVVAPTLGAGAGYAGVFANISGMQSGRSNATATLLATGRVLVTGGLGTGAAAIGSAESFAPEARAFGRFSSAGAMTHPRAYHAAVILQNGKVLLSGGIDDHNTPLGSAEIFDPATNSFSATGAMATPRWMHSATLLASGKVLIAGGSGATPAASSGVEGNLPLASAELYDPVTGTFSALSAHLVQPRYDQSATLLSGGKVLLAGGQGSFGQKLADSELFDPALGSFSATAGNLLVDPGADTGRWLFAALLLRDGTVLVDGGDGGTIAGTPDYLASGQLYHPETGVFSDLTGVMTYARGHHAAAMRIDGTVLLVGGIGADVSNPAAIAPADFLGSAELFDAATPGFSLTGSMATPRANQTATALANGKILVAGGNQGGVFLRSAELYQ